MSGQNNSERNETRIRTRTVFLSYDKEKVRFVNKIDKEMLDHQGSTIDNKCKNRLINVNYLLFQAAVMKNTRAFFVNWLYLSRTKSLEPFIYRFGD